MWVFQRRTMPKFVFLLFCFCLALQATKMCFREPELTSEQFHDTLVVDYFNHDSYKVIAIECSNPRDNSTCLYILDKIGYEPDGSWFVGRFLTPAPSLDKGFLSISKLIAPVFKRKSTINTADWKVDIGTLDPFTPNGVEFATLFTTGHLPQNLQLSGNFHFIGVATGSLMSYLGHVMKNVNLIGVDIDPQSEYLAKKWFGYVDRKNSKILIGDGAEFIGKMAERGETSDAVLVDACHSHEPADGFFCPVAAIRSAEFMENLSKVIGTRGITTFNLFHVKNTMDVYEELKASFLEYFSYCRLFSSTKSIGNVFLACSNRQLASDSVNRTQVKEFFRRVRLDRFMQYVV